MHCIHTIFFRRKQEIVETTWTSDFVGHRRACKMHCKSTEKVGCFLLVQMNSKRERQRKDICKYLWSSELQRLLLVFFISFLFSNDNILLDVKLWDKGFFLLQGSCIYNFLQYLYDKGVYKHKILSLYMILVIEHLAKTTKYLCLQEDQV